MKYKTIYRWKTNPDKTIYTKCLVKNKNKKKV